MTRTSTSWVSGEPPGRPLRFSRALINLTGKGNGISPPSSRKGVPPWAAGKGLLLSDTAPVKEPFWWPKSPASSGPSGIAPQFTATKGAWARGLARWIALARSSLPVPLGPKMHPEASEAATRLAWASRSSIEEERVMSSERHSSISPEGGLDRRIASATVSSSTLGSKGLVRNENTPRRVAVTASGIVPCAVRITTGSEGESRWIASNSAIPSIPCILRSVTTTCGRATASAASAASPDSTAVTAYPEALSLIAISCSRSLSSSTSRTRSCSRAISYLGFLRRRSSRSRIPRSIDLSASSCSRNASSRLSRSASARPRSRRPARVLACRPRQRSLSYARQRSAERAGRGPSHDVDAAVMGLGDLARDRKPESGALDAPARFGASAEKRLEDGVAFLRRHPRPGIDDLDDRLAAVGARKDRDGAATRRELHRVAEQIVENRAQLLRVRFHDRLLDLEDEVLAFGAHRQLVPAHRLRHQGVERDGARQQRGRGVHGALVVQQVLDQPLQLEAVVAHDGDHLALRRSERPRNAVGQQLRALAQRGERGFELVGKVAQEAVLLRLHLGEAPAQPVEALAQGLQVLGAAHGDRTREIRAAELPDGSVELRDRAGDVPRQAERDGERHGGTENDQQDEPPLNGLGVRAQPQHFPVCHEIADVEHFVRGVRELGGEPGDVRRLVLLPRLSHDQPVQPFLLLHGLV